MTDIQMEEKSIKKKLLVPVVVLMLCAVTLVGAGYAYTTTVQSTASVDAEFYAIEMYNDNSGTVTTSAISIADAIELQSAKVVGQNTIAVTSDAVSDYVMCYVGVYLNADTLATNPNVTMTVAGNGTGWSVSNNVATNSTYGLTITISMGTISNGYIPIEMDASAINTTVSTNNAKTAVSTVDAAIAALALTLTFTCTDE